jgi:hypothetical protein
MMLARVIRQVRLEPEVEEMVRVTAEKEGRSFSNCTNWLLKMAAQRYLVEHASDGTFELPR